MLQITIARIAFLLPFFLHVSYAKPKAARVFSENHIEGLYGRFFEYSSQGASSPCPRVIDHFNRGSPSALGKSWIVQHDKIVENGINCNDHGLLMLNSYNPTSDVPDRIKSNKIALETFTHMKEDSTGFWMGVDARKCGKWVFPEPSFVFFVKEFDRDITTSFRLKLEAGQKYMFVVSTKFTCIYLDVPRRSPNPEVVLSPGDGTSPFEGSNDTVALSTPASSEDTETESSSDKEPPSTESSTEDSTGISTDMEPPSATAGDDSEGDSGDSNLSIVDIQNGASSAPTQTPLPESIQDITENDDNSDDAAAILNEDGGEESGQTSDEFFDITAEAGDSLCFPGSAIVELAQGRAIRMDQLSIGDEARVGEGYSRIFGFTHRDPHTKHSFIRLTTRSGRSITLTAGHYLYANDRLVPAKDVRNGDRLRLTAGNGIVEKVDKVIRAGLYNPQTMRGDIVVDGAVVSCYTTAVSMWSAHALLTPIRAGWRVNRLKMPSFLEQGSFNNELARWWGSFPRAELW